MVLGFLVVPALTFSPTIPSFQEDSLILIEGNSLLSGQSGVFSNNLETHLWEMTEKYNVNYEKMWKLIQCESNWNPQAKGDKGKAFGLLQFHEPTFNFYCDQYGYDYSYYTPKHQITLAVEMISNGLIQHWKKCWNKI